MEISSFLKDLRNKQDLTLGDLARASELSPAFLSRIENQEFDKKNLSLDTIIKIAKGLNVKVKDILDTLGVIDKSELPALPVYLRQKYNIKNSKDHGVIEDIIKKFGQS